MANPEVPSGLKDLHIKIQSSNLKERRQTVDSIIGILSRQEIPEAVIRGICRLLPSTLHRYKDRTSQYLIKNLIGALISYYPDPATKYLVELFLDLTSQFQSLVVTDNVGKICINILEWTTILFHQLDWKNQFRIIKENGPKIIEAQSLLLLYIIACKKKKKITKAVALLDEIWKNLTNSDKFYLDTLKSLEQSPQVIILEATLIRNFRPDSTSVTESLEFILDGFIKNFISCKKPPLPSAVEACYPLLALITLEQFKKSISPALQKAILRNPEVILETVGIIISGVQIDLSSCCLEFGNHLITNLHSKDEQGRCDSVASIKLLAEKIKQVNAIDELLKKTFNVYHGSDGKLTIIEHKIGVLQGAGNLSFNSVPIKNFPELITKVVPHFVKVLESEAQEKALCVTLNMLALWTNNLVSEVPKSLIDIFKKGINLKSSTPLVKISYLQCMLSTFKKENISQATALIPILLKSVEKAVLQPTNPLTVSEGLYASLLLMNMSATKLEKDNEFSNMWNAVFDMDKQIFVGEKFLQATTESLPYVLQLCKILLLKYSAKIGNKKIALQKAILYCVINPARSIRTKCLLILEEMVKNDSSLNIPISLLEELNQQLDQLQKNNSENSTILAHSVVECIAALCSISSTSSNVHQLLIAAILPAHHPVVASLVPNLWIKIVKRLNFNPEICINDIAGDLMEILLKNYKPNQQYENTLATLVRYNSKIILPNILSNMENYLEDPRICQVTKDDYFIFLTPEGELYDKSAIPGEENKNEMNLKRESRVYSYKEQLEEMQLRRELEEKRKKDGKLIEINYTPKQLEAIKNQLVKEEGIRNRLKELNMAILKSISMIEAAAKGNAPELSLHYKDLLCLILQDLQSPLASPLLLKLFMDLRKTVFPNELHKSLRDTVAFITLRLSRPQCDLDPYWEKEDLNKAVNRVVGLIHKCTVSKDNDNENHGSRFNAPTFSYVFPLLKLSLSSPYIKQHDNLMHDGLQIISEHAKLRGSEQNCDEQNRIDLYHPKYLPTKQMFILLMEIICRSNSRVQAQAEACLLDVANCVSGNAGCSTASFDEIDVLLTALQNSMAVVRDAALRALLLIAQCLPDPEKHYGYALNLYKRIWIAKFDEVEDNKLLAENLWKTAKMFFPCSLSSQLLTDVEHPVECVQAAAALALAALLETSMDQVQPTIKALLKLYSDRLKMIPAKVDEFGREIEKPIDTWFPRRGVAFAIGRLAPLLTPESAGNLMQFFVSTSLSDRNETVRKEMLNAALRIVNLHGKETVGILWPIFDNFMGKSSKSAHFDAVKQAVVVLMGSLARHLDKEDERIKPIFGRLIQALSTPSQTVQEAVSNCLPPLVPSVKDDVTGYINKLMHQLLKADKYGDRKGAAYGLAGLVKGMGILALKQYDIMNKLTDAVQDKKNYKHREGALFAFEMLFQMLGKLFEPYIVHVLPHLLQCFGDSSQYVRTAADDTAKVVMSKLSGHGVKLVLPSLLDALEEDSWRTKTGSVELLGAMAYCAPKQLSSCLPSIVPKLIEVLSDSHMKVQEAGATALKVIGSVIRNPEIQAIVPTLLKALQDPSNRTSVCLQTLLDTQFVHFIDAPSLALIMPVVQRAFMDRSTETRKMAAQIIGNMYSLTDQKDLMPYLPTIIPGLKTSLLDPVPEVRSVSARALGAMVRGMGETSFDDLLPWLMHTLTSETSSVDRSGAAQGLSEVVGGLGVEKLHKLMPEIISTAERTDIAPHVKDGYIMLFIYMPVVFAEQFTPYIGQIINPILKALADENEYVRDTALKAGQRIVNLYADSAILLLLPELEKGLFDDNWRIRYSSVQLLGDLLYRISGVTGKMSTETASEDDNFGTEQSHKAIINALGAERRNRVLAGLYMGRSDVSLMVRQSALHVWKVVVTNTPRTLREILPTLFSLLLGCLASDSFDKRQVAARTLGDLVRKLGERVLPDIIPILERGLESNRPDQRQGVCIGLSEIMASTSKDMVLNFVHSLVPTVRKALSDPLPEVRQAAAKTFDSLHSTVGTRALDDILPALLHQLGGADPQVVEYTLDGLRQVMAIKSRVVLPYLVPQLTAPPANTKALSILASVAGEALNKYLPKILPALQKALAASRGTPEEAQQLEYCQAVILSVIDDIGIRTIIDTMVEDTKNENVDQRRAAATLLCAFCANSKAQYTAHVPQLLRTLIHLCTDSDREVLQMSWDALNAVTKTLEPKQQATFVSDVRQAVRFAMSDMKSKSELLPGFCLPKGIAPILPIFREAILSGDADEKEAAAQGLGEVIKVTSAIALQPSVVAITGPLIRILGDRFSPQVKTAVLDTLAVLLSKVGLMLKQFLPQLQTTFIKSLNDSNRHVRIKSGAALSQLILIHQRADPLFTEIHNMIKNNEENSIKETSLHALRGMISPAGDKMSEPVKKQIYTTLMVYLSYPDDVVRRIAAGCLGAICSYLSEDQLDVTLDNILNDDSNQNTTLREGKATALTVALKEAPERLWNDRSTDKLIKALLSQLTSSISNIIQSAIRSCGYLFNYLLINDERIPSPLLGPFVRTMNNQTNDVKQLLAKVCFYLAKMVPPDKMTAEFLKAVIPTLVNGTKEKNVYVKANSEIALIGILKLKEGDKVYQKYSALLDVGPQESLADVVSKVLKKILQQPDGKDEDIDDTLLT